MLPREKGGERWKRGKGGKGSDMLRGEREVKEGELVMGVRGEKRGGEKQKKGVPRWRKKGRLRKGSKY